VEGPVPCPVGTWHLALRQNSPTRIRYSKGDNELLKSVYILLQKHFDRFLIDLQVNRIAWSDEEDTGDSDDESAAKKPRKQEAINELKIFQVNISLIQSQILS
jgi:hypothetical protein